MNYLDYTIILTYSLLMLIIGIYVKDCKNSTDFFHGGRNFGWMTLLLSVMATQLSAVSFISAPAFVGFKTGGGLKWLTFEFAVPIAMIFVAVVIIPPLYRSGVVSAYEYLEKRFGRSTRLLISSVFLLSRSTATGVSVYALAMTMETMFHISFFQSIALVCVVTALYSLKGGMRAVIISDAVQMVILLLSIVVCWGYGYHYIGGWSGFTAAVDPERVKIMDFSKLGFNGDEYGMLPMLIGGLFLYTSYYGTDQTQVQRALSAKSLKTVRQTYLINGFVRFLITLAYCTMGLLVGAFMLSKPEMVKAIGSKPDLMLPTFMLHYLPNGVMGFVLVGILSAAMSTYSSVFNSLSAVAIEDFLARGKKLDQKTYIRWARLTSLFWMSICVVVACFVGDFAPTVIEAINKIGSLFYGPILMLFLVAILSKKTTALSVNIGLIVGVATNLYIWKYEPQIFWFWWNLIGAGVTFVVIFIVRLIQPYILPFSDLLSESFLFSKNLGYDNLQQNALMPLPSSESLKHYVTETEKDFKQEVLIWNKHLIRYSIAFFVLILIISYWLQMIL
ncbi:MAG: sodium/solute symporter [Saprospiraceae bacterium]|nr:sodium/solute symporter [Saprospiraceae bacterium]